MSATTVILIQIKKIIRAFHEAGATSPARSIIPAEHGMRHSLVFQKLVRQGVLVPVNEERYYLDEAVAARQQSRRQMIVRIILLVMAAGLVVAALTRQL